MKRAVALICLMVAVMLSIQIPLRGQNSANLTARDYFKELIASGGLEGTTKKYACFQDDPNADSFFLLGESKSVRESMLADGTFNRLPGETQELMKKEFLTVRGYPKGIPWRGEEFLGKDESSWISDARMLDESTPIRIRLKVDWQTLRYKYAVELLNLDSTYRTEVASFGRCEQLPA